MLVDAHLEQELQALRDAGLLRRPLAISGRGPRVHVAGHALVSFSSNDYLGLASHPRLLELARAAHDDEPEVGSTASRLITGTKPAHLAAERRLAALVRRPAALLFSTGYAANVGALPALIGWTAAGGGAADFGGWVLFGIFFLWQLPHVLSLAWLLQDDYRSVGFFLTPPSDPDGRKIGRHMVFHALSLVLLGFAPTLLGLTGWIYGGGSFVLNVAMLAVCLAAAREMSEPKVKRVFFWSLLYQPLILALLLIDTHPHP